MWRVLSEPLFQSQWTVGRSVDTSEANLSSELTDNHHTCGKDRFDQIGSPSQLTLRRSRKSSYLADLHPETLNPLTILASIPIVDVITAGAYGAG